MVINHSFRAPHLTLLECVYGGGTYINALFLTCLACFWLALNECVENKGLWLFWSHHAGFLSYEVLFWMPFCFPRICEENWVCHFVREQRAFFFFKCFDMMGSLWSTSKLFFIFMLLVPVQLQAADLSCILKLGSCGRWSSKTVIVFWSRSLGPSTLWKGKLKKAFHVSECWPLLLRWCTSCFRGL